MEELLQNSAVLFVIVTLLYVVITDLKMTERLRVLLVYIFSFVLAIAGIFEQHFIWIGSAVVLFLALEFLTDDTWRLQLFTRPDYKLIDFLYRMFVEYAYAPFLASLLMIVIGQLPQVAGTGQITAYSLGGILLVISLFILTAKKYATKSISDIIAQLEGDMLTYQLDVTPHMADLFLILTAMEDRAYFERSDTQHTIPFGYFIRKSIGYIQGRTPYEIWWAIRGLFTRGYGTIEMQLLRSIGIEYGYQYTYQRKIFEVLYANMIFNGYRGYLIHGRGDYSQYRAFIIHKYIESVDVRINGKLFRPYNGRSSLLWMYGADSLENISREQFFVWCLGLPQRDYIYDWVLDYYDDIMYIHDIDRRRVKVLLGDFTYV